MSRMRGDSHVRFCESLRGRFPWATRRLILCKTRNQLRTVVRLMYVCLEQVEQTVHPFKTFIGKIKETGFDFLGYRIGGCVGGSLGLAWKP